MERTAFHFASFVVSRARRQLLRDGCAVPLVPRYFDLLLLLIERRGEAVHRRELLDAVWSDVVVSDNALNQAVRTLRRALGDDPREPTFIRTASRHGYQFVYTDVREIEELAPARVAAPATAADPPRSDGEFDRALAVLLSQAADEDRRDAAETLLRIDADRARRELEQRGNAALALATLRDARWNVAGAAPVPFLGHTGMWRSGFALARLRLGELWSLARRRWAAAVLGGMAAGAVAGALGGSALWLGPGATGTAAVVLVLAILGAAIGGLGAAGVAAGLTLCEVTFRAARAPALIAGGAAGGAAIGALCHGLAALLLQGLFGKDLSAIAGGTEGLAIGAATGLGYALATPRRSGGLATPTGVQRAIAALLAGAICALTTGLLAWNGSFLAGRSSSRCGTG
ncbi:MAG: transcriptional regulator [Deltaproteobacteria bacterium]|nr:MAG: transcriptional regulator [Deltaproteobacteria bacterium]